jgi:hypothetical protein
LNKNYCTFTNKEKLAREMIDGWSNQELKRFAKWQLQKDFDSLTDNQFIHKFKRFYKLEEYKDKQLNKKNN